MTSQHRRRLAVIGGGVVGLSVARALAVEGADVTLFERSYVGSGTSELSFAWVNSNGKKPQTYHELNCAGMLEHVQLQSQAKSHTRATWLDECGTFEWARGADQVARLCKRADSLRERGYPVERVSFADVRRRLPDLHWDGCTGDVWHYPTESMVYPHLLMAWLRSQASALNCVVRENTGVVALEETSQGVTMRLASGEKWQGEACVLATGRWIPELTRKLGAPLAMINADEPNKRACGFLAMTPPLAIQLDCNLITPELNVRPIGGGRLMLQAPDLDQYAHPAYLPALDGSVGQEFTARLSRLFAHIRPGSLQSIRVGQRARPADGLPAVGYLVPGGRVYAVVTHSGITLAPLLGRLAAVELMRGERHPLLSAYSPARLIGKVQDDFSEVETIHYPAAQ
ncbi:FAD-binding oxidoreductase [Stenotrophomonas sp. S41]|uniref:NAD(P)/FAD-dependent oxidoreductase n=1 Tax=Stenotrophomonas sp. S41 TaxID=2767464 RepID=UPI00190B2D5A|nr:FAD-binding oxidoreductase [Stenotrophomonas sp. S41]MBK0010787.1 FAD-binding oxidoreductase [Stenotrophomonas sp. S41]